MIINYRQTNPSGFLSSVAYYSALMYPSNISTLFASFVRCLTVQWSQASPLSTSINWTKSKASHNTQVSHLVIIPLSPRKNYSIIEYQHRYSKDQLYSSGCRPLKWTVCPPQKPKNFIPLTVYILPVINIVNLCEEAEIFGMIILCCAHGKFFILPLIMLHIVYVIVCNKVVRTQVRVMSMCMKIY